MAIVDYLHLDLGLGRLSTLCIHLHTDLQLTCEWALCMSRTRHNRHSCGGRATAVHTIYSLTSWPFRFPI